MYLISIMGVKKCWAVRRELHEERVIILFVKGGSETDVLLERSPLNEKSQHCSFALLINKLTEDLSEAALKAHVWWAM